MSKSLPEILSVSTLAKGNVFHIQSVDLRFSNGEQRTYERLKPGKLPSVMILPIHNNELVMIKEYAVGPECYELTFPKGKVDEGETPEQSANRELREEVGFAAGKLTLLRSLYSSPSHMFGLMHVFVAEELFPSPLASGDEPEPLEVVRFPLSAIDKLLADPDFAESRNLAALFLLKGYLAAQN